MGSPPLPEGYVLDRGDPAVWMLIGPDGEPYADALAVVRLEELAELLRECDEAS